MEGAGKGFDQKANSYDQAKETYASIRPKIGATHK